MTTVHQAQPIAAGYAYSIRLQLMGGGPFFPDGCTLRAEVRDYPGAPTLAGLLTSDSGLVSVIDDVTVELFLSPALTGALSRQTCSIDLVRTDLAPARWLGVQVMLPVLTTVTRSPADVGSPERVIVSQGVPALASISAPLGVTVALSAAEGGGPWNQEQLLAPAAITSTVVASTPMLVRAFPSGIVPLTILAGSLGVPQLTLFASPLAIASTSLVIGPAITDQPPAAVIAIPAPASTIIPAPGLAIPSADLIAVPLVGSAALVAAPSIVQMLTQGILLTGSIAGTAFPTPVVAAVGVRLVFSGPVSRNVGVPSGTTVVGRQLGSTLSTSIPGITIDSATGAVTGTPTSRAGLITETLNGVSRNSLLFMPDATARTMKLGMNVSVFSYYTPNLVWLDYLKASDNVTVGTGVTYDANGMPQVGATGVHYLFPMDDGTATSFDFRIITDGDIDVRVQNSTNFVAMTRTSDGFTGTWSGQPGTQFVNHLFVDAVRTAPTYLALVREDETALWRAWKAGTRAHRFKDSFVGEMQRFSRFRDLDWSCANEAAYTVLPPNALSYRNQGGYQNYVPAAVKAELCLAAGIDWWACIPKDTTDAFYQSTLLPAFQIATAAGHKVINEWANEVWNYGFPQYAYATEQFDAVQGATIDNAGFKFAWFVGYRSAQLARLARGTGVQWVAGVQPVVQGAAHYVDDGLAFAGGSWSDFFGWTCSAYPGGSWGQHKADIGDTQYARQKAWVAAGDYDAGMDDVINDTGAASISVASSLSTYWPAAKANAGARALKLVAYEGSAVSIITNGVYGNNTADPTVDYAGFDAYCVALAYSSLARGAALTLCLAMQQAGFDEFMYYAFSGDAAGSGVGVWGAWGHPAYDGLKDFLAVQTLAPITIDLLATRSGDTILFTARRAGDVSAARNAVATIGKSTSYLPGAAPSDANNFQSVPFAFAAGAATATFAVLSPTAVPE